MVNLNNIIFAHRGIYNNINVVENSLQSFELCKNSNIPIELDIHLLNDDTLIVFHDFNLKRLTGIDKSIYDLPYKSIKKLKLLDTNQTIPTLNEVLKLIDGDVLINIEIKNNINFDKLYDNLDKVLNTYKGNIIMQSFFPNIVRKINKIGKYNCGLLINEKEKFLLNKVFLKYIKPKFIAVNKKIIKNNKIQKLRNKYPILIWTINYNNLDKYKKEASSFICNIKNGVQERI